MASTSETGHPINVANFNELITCVKGYEKAYIPSKVSIQLTSLHTLSSGAESAMNAVNIADAAYRNAVSAREVSFEPLSQHITRIMNALKATDTSKQVDESAKTLARKIQGVRATPKKTEEQKKAAIANGGEIVEISTSQMSYDNRLDNYYKLITLLKSILQYTPNEEDLKVEMLNRNYDDLKTKNTAVVTASVSLNNARIQRNDIMYKEITGLYDIAADVKTYVKSVFGATSPQYKQISKIKFTKPR